MLAASPGGTVSGATSTRYVAGSLQKLFSATAGQSFTFPIGDASAYTPVALASMNVTAPGSVTASTTSGEHPTIATSGINASKDECRGVTFQGSGFGNLNNVAVGPSVTPSDYGYQNFLGSGFGMITIIPTDPNSYLRLISFKIASLNDNDVDETGVTFYINTVDGTSANFIGSRSEATVAGDVNSATHTLHTFGGTPITGIPGQGFELLWEARNGHVALDDFKFEVVSPPVIQNDFYTVTQGETLSVPAPVY